jgi:hypothetical protein
MHTDHLAFTMLTRLDDGDPMYASDVALPNGEHPHVGDPIRCGTCGVTFDWTRAIHKAYA